MNSFFTQNLKMSQLQSQYLSIMNHYITISETSRLFELANFTYLKPNFFLTLKNENIRQI